MVDQSLTKAAADIFRSRDIVETRCVGQVHELDDELCHFFKDTPLLRAMVREIALPR
jgi:hypothetical protein